MPRPAAPTFAETQWLMRRWWWVLLILFATAGLVPFYGKDAANFDLKTRLLLEIPTALAALLLGSLHMQVRLDADGAHYRYFPLLRWRHLPWAELRQVYARRYAPWADYGGWGVRGRGTNKAYTVWGRDGLQLVRQDKTLILLGTQRPQELQEALRGLKAALPTLPVKRPEGY